MKIAINGRLASMKVSGILKPKGGGKRRKVQFTIDIITTRMVIPDIVSKTGARVLLPASSQREKSRLKAISKEKSKVSNSANCISS